MFSSVKKYFSERKRTILSATAFIGGTYLAGHYALRRLEEMREKMVEDKTAKEKLVKPFSFSAIYSGLIVHFWITDIARAI